MKQQKNGGKSRLKNDVIFIGGLLILLLLLGLALFFLREEGDTVTVTVDGVVYAVYPLHTDITVDIRSGENGVNRLIIQNGEAFVESASCPDGICAAHRPIHREGENIVCLPNRVVITVGKKSGGDAPDILA